MKESLAYFRVASRSQLTNQNVTKCTADHLRSVYPPGARVELLSMDDPYRDMPFGLQGTVKAVDDMGTIHIAWDNGSSLGVVYGVDSIRKL